MVAVDQRGVGGSAPSTTGYDAVNLAEDVYQLTQQLGLEQVYVVGHDVGGWVAYALARRHPEALRGVMVLETLVPGIEPWLDLDIDARAYREPGHLRAAFEPYRAIPANMAFNLGERTAIDVPLLLAGAEHVFGPALPELADRLRTEHGWAHVEVEVLADARHYLVEEQPDAVTRLIELCAS